MRKIIIVATAIVLCCLYSCNKDEDVTLSYNFGITKFESSQDLTQPEDLAKVTDFLKAHNCPMEPQTFTAKSKADCDAKALAGFNEAISSFTRADVAALGLDASTSFTYSASRQDNGNTIEIGSFVYP
ncbi:MAG: hypothetical protein LBR84_02990 [Tannerella sp.]|nr:hypothetical protein [Tannerella sp.]